MYFVSFYLINSDGKQIKNGAKKVNKQTIQHSVTDKLKYHMYKE